MTLWHSAPEILYDALITTPSAAQRYRVYLRTLRHYVTKQTEEPLQTDPMRKRIQNASDACGTGAQYFIWFRLEQAIRHRDRRELHTPTDLQTVTSFVDYIRGEPSVAYKPFKGNIKAGSQWAYIANATKALRVFTNVDWNAVPALQDVRTDMLREIQTHQASKFPFLLEDIRGFIKRARDPDVELLRGAQTTYADASAALRTWSCSLLLQFLGILRYCEAADATSTRANPTRLLSWGVGLTFFRLKDTWQWVRQDVPLGDLEHKEVDGIELTWRAGVATKGNQAARHRRTRAIWDPRSSDELPKLAAWLREIYLATTKHNARRGTPVFMVETKRLGWVTLDNARFNKLFKLVAKGIASDAGDASSRQLRSGGKTSATWSEFSARMQDVMATTSAFGRWAEGSKVGNSDRYEQRHRERFFGIAEQMLTGHEDASPAAWSTLERIGFEVEIRTRDALRGRCQLQ